MKGRCGSETEVDMSQDNPHSAFEDDYSETGFWQKLTGYAKAAGQEVVEKALWLYYAAKTPGTPAWAKGTIYGALGYFINPIDAIPDLSPIIGYTDDLGALALAIAVVASHIDKAVKEQAQAKVSDWFGDKKAVKGESGDQPEGGETTP